MRRTFRHSYQHNFEEAHVIAGREMVEVGMFVDEVKSSDVEFFAGVRDSLLKGFCAYVTYSCVARNATPPLLLHQWGQTL